MAELTTRDDGPPPADLPRGECICTRLDGGDIRIDQADPRILISSELLTMLTAPDSEILPAWQRNARLEPGSGPGLYGGCILKICGVNRTVIYRITEYVPRIHGYIGEWPD